MAPEEWTTPADVAGFAGDVPAKAPRPAPVYELRPLSLGEILDRTFTVYRSRFWLFAGLGSVCAGFQVLLSAVQLIPLHMMPRAGTPGTPGVTPHNDLPNFWFGEHMGLGLVSAALVMFLLYLLAFVVTQAATVFAVGEVYLGKPATIAGSVRATWKLWYRYLGIGIWQGWSMLWVPLLVTGGGGLLLYVGGDGLKVVGGILVFLGLAGGVPVGVVLALRNALSVQTSVIESVPMRASMRRSKVLTVGAKWRIFVVGLLAGALDYAASLLQMPLIFIVTFTLLRGGRAIGSEIAMLVVGFVGRAVVQPVLMIGVSLVYFDQRVRKEALDLVMLLDEETAVLAGSAEPASVMLPAEVVEIEPAGEPVVDAAPPVAAPSGEPENETGRADDAEPL